MSVGNVESQTRDERRDVGRVETSTRLYPENSEAIYPAWRKQELGSSCNVGSGVEPSCAVPEPEIKRIVSDSSRQKNGTESRVVRTDLIVVTQRHQGIDKDLFSGRDVENLKIVNRLGRCSGYRRQINVGRKARRQQLEVEERSRATEDVRVGEINRTHAKVDQIEFDRILPAFDERLKEPRVARIDRKR